MDVVDCTISMFRKTEWLLRYYPSYKTLIDEKKAKVELLRKYGLQEFSKSIVILSASSNNPNIGLEELLEEEIDKNVRQIAWLTKVVELIDLGLAEVRSDPYYGIIERRYWSKHSMERIADYYNTASTTIYRNRDRLVHRIQNVIFAGDRLKMVMEGEKWDKN